MVILGLVLFLFAAGFTLAWVGGSGSLRGAERAYLALAPLPATLTLVAPAAIGVARGFDSASRTWINGLSWTGVGLSVVLTAIGIGLIARAATRSARWGWPLGGAVVLAAAPAMLIAVTYLLRLLALLLIAGRGSG
jgi:hypothetical protein